VWIGSAWRDEYHSGRDWSCSCPYRLGRARHGRVHDSSSARPCAPADALLNLESRLTGGPTGTWQQVIWHCSKKAAETAAMIQPGHCPARRGPVDGNFPLFLRGNDWTSSGAVREKRKTMSVAGSPPPKARASRCSPRSAGAAGPRDPLLYQTLCQFAKAKLHTAAGAVFAIHAAPLDLHGAVEAR